MHQNNTTFSGNEGVTVPHRLQTDIDHAPRWQDVLQAPAFQELMKKKKAFILPSVVFFSVFYLAWPILGGFTTLLDAPTIGEMPLAYVYGFSQFPLMLILLSLYRRQASKWDDLAQQALAEATERRVG
ncbi:uncharacterized membrane protein (DUF485 family) [Arthrobacter sp. V1I7]|uniref:DUF485 domain-containing protein n=1 Tax=Arthrobacter sp. V1I7 TaxID=3042274 RepID=UPI002782737B|nr:DUF485 domain-containing protein [Arthrobacter sp. V1I7]MDQ0823782.1 uncharacterized membrane protein (DUF485 family) [Arthrobacter sp. V1I7]